MTEVLVPEGVHLVRHPSQETMPWSGKANLESIVEVRYTAAATWQLVKSNQWTCISKCRHIRRSSVSDVSHIHALVKVSP
jgi:hypothetical protein